jgi:phosphoglucosamine mutase
VEAATSAAPRRLFGTDGVRGLAGEFVSAELALALARAAAARVHPPDRPARVLVIRDTRESGEMLEAAVAAGIAAAGGEALLGGILPTPGAPLLIQRHGFDLGVVISASHNPYQDNGIKFFGGDGYKLSDATEAEIERALTEPPAIPPHTGRVRRFAGALEEYLQALEERFGALDLRGRRILLDCANGATYQAAPEIFRRLGADVGVIADQPNGVNINDRCGSTHLDRIKAGIQATGDDAGFAFDGDGDRVLGVDRNGAVVDGDELIALAALHLREHGRLAGNGVAVTVMTNYGFHTAMSEHGVDIAITPVGDRYVLEELRRRDWSLGGEQSGHIIDRSFVPSGDGIAAALLTLEALPGRDLADRAAMHKLPQKLVNVRVRDKALAESDAVLEAVAHESAALEGIGRVLLRPSGTEALIRVMVEAPTSEDADAACARLVAVLEACAG